MRFIISAIILPLIAVSLAACGDGATRVRMDDRVNLAAVRQEPTASPDSPTLRIAVAGVMSPTRTVDEYTGLISYLQATLGRPVELSQRGSYAEINEMVRSGQADIAFVCSRAYIEGQRQFGMQLLAVPQVDGATVYYSYLIVSAASTAQRLEDLRGGTFAFSDPLSNSGHLTAQYELALRGETPNTFFRDYEFTGSHDNSIVAVADGLRDGAAVDSLVYDHLRQRDPALIARTKVIERWGPYGMPPVVVSPLLPAEEREQLRRVLFGMADQAAGRAALDQLGWDRFVPIDDAAYDPIRKMMAVVQGTGE